MSKVEHVSRLIHRRDDLVHRREELAKESAQIDQGIATIDAEIERAWQGVMSAPPMIPLSSLIMNGHKHAAVATGAAGVGEDFHDDDDDDEEDENPEERESHANRILAMLRRSNTLDYGQIAMEIYNEDTPQTRKRVRATLSYLKRSNRIRNLARNQWEVRA